MDDIDMPDEDESLTVSSMSQSPFLVSQRNITSSRYSTNNPQNTQKNPLTHKIGGGTSTEHDLTTLGRSDEDRLALGQSDKLLFLGTHK